MSCEINEGGVLKQKNHLGVVAKLATIYNVYEKLEN
jgi:hypothetical protein